MAGNIGKPQEVSQRIFFDRGWDENILAKIRKQRQFSHRPMVEQRMKRRISSLQHAAVDWRPFGKYNRLGFVAYRLQREGIAPDDVALQEKFDGDSTFVRSCQVLMIPLGCSSPRQINAIYAAFSPLHDCQVVAAIGWPSLRLYWLHNGDQNDRVFRFRVPVA